MRRAALVVIVGSVVALGQAQDNNAGGADNPDRAAAYYRYTMAIMYARMASSASMDRKREYAEKAIENYRAAIKADPTLGEELAAHMKTPTPILLPPTPRLPARR